MYYETNYLRLNQMCKFLGIGRTRMLEICQARTHGFPAVKVGNRWQADINKLTEWKDKWENGEFEL